MWQMENYRSKVSKIVYLSVSSISMKPTFVSPLRLTWIHQPSWRPEFLCSRQRNAGSVKPPRRRSFQTCFSSWSCRRHRVNRNRKDGVWRRWSQGTFNPSGVGTCLWMRFVFIFQEIFFVFHVESYLIGAVWGALLDKKNAKDPQLSCRTISGWSKAPRCIRKWKKKKKKKKKSALNATGWY